MGIYFVIVNFYNFDIILGDEDLNPIQFYNDANMKNNEDILSYMSNDALNDSVCSLSDSLLNILE